MMKKKKKNIFAHIIKPPSLSTKLKLIFTRKKEGKQVKVNLLTICINLTYSVVSMTTKHLQPSRIRIHCTDILSCQVASILWLIFYLVVLLHLYFMYSLGITLAVHFRVRLYIKCIVYFLKYVIEAFTKTWWWELKH